MAKLRLGPSGPPIVGVATGDVLRWNSVTQEWDVGALPPTPGITEFDHLISSRDDLVAVVAPVAGEFLLPSGSYFFKERVLLNDGERAVIDGTNVFMMGGGTAINNVFVPPAVPATRGLVGNYADDDFGVIVRGLGQLYASNMVFGAASPSRYGVNLQAGTVRLIDCVLETGGGGLQAGLLVEAGILEAERCLIGSSGHCLGITGGTEVILHNCNLINFGVGRCVTLSSSAAMRLVFDSCRMRSADQDRDVVTLDDPAVDVAFYNCNISGASAESAIIGLVQAGEAVVSGGKLTAYGCGTRAGIVISTGFEYLDIFDVIAEALSVFVYCPPGVVSSRCHIANNTLRDTVPIGVDWDATAIPSSGLLELGNIVDSASPFANHTSATAGVMRRACISAGTPLTETVITP